MIYLSGAPLPGLSSHRIGYMRTPNFRTDRYVKLNTAVWAADTGCYSPSGASSFDLDRYLCWLDAHSQYRSTCLFATAPDVVGDADATWERSRPVLPVLRGMGYLASLVAQDGITTPDWQAFDVLFLGGTNAFKESEQAYELVAEAHRRGKWCHAGRVNSYRRLKAMAHAGVDSADGTFLKYGPDVNLPRLLNWLTLLDIRPKLEVA